MQRTSDRLPRPTYTLVRSLREACSHCFYSDSIRPMLSRLLRQIGCGTVRVIDLIPGVKILDTFTGKSHTYVAQCRHPLYRGLQLVVWRMADGSWSHDALSCVQDVGDVDMTAVNYETNLIDAFQKPDVKYKMT
jgi:hypothetical protein